MRKPPMSCWEAIELLMMLGGPLEAVSYSDHLLRHQVSIDAAGEAQHGQGEEPV